MAGTHPSARVSADLVLGAHAQNSQRHIAAGTAHYLVSRAAHATQVAPCLTPGSGLSAIAGEQTNTIVMFSLGLVILHGHAGDPGYFLPDHCRHCVLGMNAGKQTQALSESAYIVVQHRHRVGPEVCRCAAGQ